MTDITHYVRSDGTYWGQADTPPDGCFAVPTAPDFSSQTWDGSGWSIAVAPLLPLTRRQLRRGLHSLGVRTADVEEKIAALPDDQREIALIDWQDASTYDRNHPLVLTLGSAFSLTEDQINAAWLEAQEL